MRTSLQACCWPPARLGEAMTALAHRSGLTSAARDVPEVPEILLRASKEGLGRWIDSTAAWLGLEAEPAEMPYGEVAERLKSAAPALVRLANGNFLALVDGCRAVGPDLVERRIRPDDIRSAVYSDVETPLAADADLLIQVAGVAPRRRQAARSAILGDLLSEARAGDCWLLRLPPGTGFRRLLVLARVPQRLLTLAGAHLFEYLLWIAAWWVAGQGALQGRLDPAWLAAWALLLLTMVPFRAFTTWLQGMIAIVGGGILKERLLYGALRLNPEEIRNEGAGRLLGRVIESQSLESLALSGGFLSLVAVLELVLAAVVLGAGGGGILHVGLLAGWTVLSGLLGACFLLRTRHWTGERLWMTHDLVERMVGHRTRLAQEEPGRWHDGEDAALERYLEASKGMDRMAAMLVALVPRGWLLAGILGLAPSFVSGDSSPAALAISIGGILLAFQAFRRLASGWWQLVGAAVAWEQVAPLFHAAARRQAHGSPAAFLPRRDGGAARTVIEAHDLVFRYRKHGEPVLRGCSLWVSSDDRLVLEGPSGGGKSTLASLLAGIRQPESGLLLVGGLDRNSLGANGWRRIVAAAPQFHENHVLTGTLAFNLLMGRPGVPGAAEMEEAAAVCHELGLGDLLARMPAGLLQVVGETGWQLSHGERSRLYIARALLQGADLVVLDESFAALDPENLRLALDCVNRRAGAVLTIAHR